MFNQQVEAIEEKPDPEKNYVCYFCEEVVEHTETESSWEKGRFFSVWRHVNSGQNSCGTTATPSNIEVSKE